MSEFFNVTLDKNVILNDGVISNKTGWTSEKIYKEIIDKRLTKFEELEDVDVTRKKDKQVLAYSEATGKFVSMYLEGVEGAGGISIQQVSKAGLIGSAAKPHSIKIPINTVDFRVPSVNVLKYKNDNKYLIQIENEFTKDEEIQFKKDEMIVFDGKSHLKTEFENKWIIIEETDTAIESTVDINLDLFKSIEKFHDDIEEGVMKKLGITAIPHDRILTPISDINLSNVKYINGFDLKAIGKNIRIVVSDDSGKSWRTFSAEKWHHINLNIDDIKEKDMTIEFFNKINPLFWNELITKDKVRFAYLFSMDNIQDKEELDALNLKYDGQGTWIQAKESEYDVIYESNTILAISVKFSGDIKINY
ncbi:hypothetical protein [Clostridium botulinum]|uniref:hypothetical protein n=1 Tax=Clostridium botulinum TaxID=1491 RepID=UPI0004D3F1BD|nr:hypothetical protein [Clostridium botulinum]KEH99974.1 signal peptidase II [Clostridium botulinum C/D str. BKT75002]KEI05696.1 signal peptidase II [Clostridium botulinum C/D str. BKT2873]MCD3351770.1 signal peptidase II [Clostridium botulinum D/C]MCD3360696.1 signal peptidase II [Clostridium botulinum D/C]MCD3362122.1 signal peptidase II [Clostridium botulinum D/C]